jgi:hypothetical protein
MSSTRKTPEHLNSAKNLRGVAEAVAAEAVGAVVASEAALAAEGVARLERQAARRWRSRRTGCDKCSDAWESVGFHAFVLIANVRFSHSCLLVKRLANL